MSDDNTSAVVDVNASVDQNTVDETTKEPVEQVEPKKFLGKYNSEEDAQKAFASIQERARQAEERLKETKNQLDAKSLEEFKKLDYEQQMEFLLSRDKEREGTLNQLYQALAQGAEQSEQVALDKFIASEPLIKETGLDEEFRLLVTHPSLKEYTIESIFNARLKPKIEKLMGTKITVKERKIPSSDNQPNETKDVSRMSSAEYEKHREEILRGAGVKV